MELGSDSSPNMEFIIGGAIGTGAVGAAGAAIDVDVENDGDVLLVISLFFS